jgi:hypothetical protein
VYLAYGAAKIIDYPAYGLQFRPDKAVSQAAITAMLKQGLSYDKQSSDCMVFTAQQLMRLVKLADDLYSLLLAAADTGDVSSPDEAAIVGDLVAANLGLPSLSAASTGPFRICGDTFERVAALGIVPTSLSQPVSIYVSYWSLHLLVNQAASA